MNGGDLMLKRIWKSRKQVLNNDGSVLSIAFVVIAVLTFSLTTITSMSVTSSKITNNKLDQVSNDSDSRGEINLAMTEFKNYVETNSAFPNLTDFNAGIFLKYGVTTENVTANFPAFAAANNADIQVFKFYKTLENGNVLYRDMFVSNYGSEVIQIEQFNYSMASSADMVLNGGYYIDTKLFGNNIYLNQTSPYMSRNTGQATITPTPAVNNTDFYPKLTNLPGQTLMYPANEFKYCSGNCYSSTTNRPFIFDKTLLSDVTGSNPPDSGAPGDLVINSFFGDFVFEDFVMKYIKEVAPEASEQMPLTSTYSTVGSDVANNSGPLTKVQGNNYVLNHKFHNVTGDSGFNFAGGNKITLSYSTYVDPQNHVNTVGDTLIIDRDIAMTQTHDNSDESLFVDGDVLINSTANGQNGKISITGTMVVNGDLTITGKSLNLQGTFIVLGEVIFDFDDGHGMKNPGANLGSSILSRHNIYFESFYENHGSALNTETVSVFMFSNESIYIDAVNNRINLAGSIYANAFNEVGYTPSITYMNDTVPSSVKGIIVNSYYGYVRANGSHSSGSQLSHHGFIIDDIDKNVYSSRFYNIPTFNSVVTSEGVYSFELGEFTLE